MHAPSHPTDGKALHCRASHWALRGITRWEGVGGNMSGLERTGWNQETSSESGDMWVPPWFNSL